MKLIRNIIGSIVVSSILIVPALSPVEAKAAALLKVGSTGSEVVELQKNLTALGYFTYSSATGNYGNITKYSVMRFQKDHGLSVDGIAGPKTLAKIDELMSSKAKGTHVVKVGDTPYLISKWYGVSLDKLLAINNLSSGDYIYPGQVLKLSGVPFKSAPVAESQNEDLYWLSRIIEAEAGAEPYSGKVAVGSVVLNRKASPDFPNTVKGVIFEYYKGIPQFTPVADGTIYNTPSQDSINAAKEAIRGSKPVGNATYFFNPDKSPADWIVANKTFVKRIGNHVFYK